MRSLAVFPTAAVFGILRRGFFAAVTGMFFAAMIAGCASVGVPDDTIGWSAEKLYTEAKDEMSSANWGRAAKLFEKLESRYPYGLYAQQAQLELAYTYYKDQEPASSLATCDRFIKLHPNHPNVDYAFYLKGLVQFNDDLGLLGALAAQDLTERDPKAARESFDAFKTLAVRFPNSKYAADSFLRMAYLVNALASSEVHVARYYLRRGAYLAAVSRAQTALQNYQEAPANEEGIAIMVAAYDKLGATELRDASQRVLQKNFPNSRHLAGYNPPKLPWYRLW